MKIHKWLNNPLSAVNGIAVVEVEAGEKPAIEDFLRIVDGDNVGHFGYSVTLMTEEEPPKGDKGQFGFRSASQLEDIKRYYKVFVHRD